jgi:hypothetical protein
LQEPFWAHESQLLFFFVMRVIPLVGIQLVIMIGTIMVTIIIG